MRGLMSESGSNPDPRLLRRLPAALLAAALLCAVTILPLEGASAVEVPASGSPWYIQTNGPNAAAGTNA